MNNERVDAVHVILDLTTKHTLSDDETENLANAISVVAEHSAEVLWTTMLPAVILILGNPLLSRCHVLMVQVLRDVIDSRTIQDINSGIVDLLIARVMDDSIFPLGSAFKLNCLWCISRAAEGAKQVRIQLLTSGLVEYLANAYREGQSDGEVQDLCDRDCDGNFQIQICFILQLVCRESFLDEAFKPAIFVLVDLVKRSSDINMLQCCLSELTHWASADVRRQEYLCTLTPRLMDILLENDKLGSEMNRLNIAFYKSIFAAFGLIIRTGKCPELLVTIQGAYRQFAQSFSPLSKSRAAQIARAAEEINVDYFGRDSFVGEYKSPIHDFREAILYYKECLLQSLSSEHQVSAVLGLICEFAAETYRRGQLVDVMDKRFEWCAAEISDIGQDHRVKIHYTAWDTKFDEWILISHKIAPAFTYTRLEIPPERQFMNLPPGRHDHSVDRRVDLLTRCELLGLTSSEKATKIVLCFEHDFQNAVNYARWMNRDNLKTFV
eukprot:TRINITY_DN2312_c0_g1_i2.p1 TRINITY_DN2312_c0_g1~~TRINITY_DN2312_c0_g1_i2.p1  ORF type:complete len:495 (+),score=76.37 TRINITY_DN2312_c0_g1_i2:116-1600(+)